MNWKLILRLSMFGLVMGIATVFVIPSEKEPILWFFIFLACAWLIARKCRENLFRHGLMVGILNSVWITAAHVLLFDRYSVNHQSEVGAMRMLPISPQVMMVATGPIGGVVFGTLIGLLAMLAGKLLPRRRSAV